jgi:tetratricopeptide (TPR) repeat protein
MALDPQRVRTVFLAAAQYQKPADRAVVLDTACADDSELRHRVELLLLAHDRSDGSLDEPLAGSPPGAPPATVTHSSGSGLAVTAGAAGGTRRPTNRAVPAIEGYEVVGELGRGGMGVVYRARQVLLNRPCVLKMILAGVHAEAEAVVRFLAEAEAVARLQHPNIVQIHNIGEADGLPYFELEYVEGGSLDRRLDGTPWTAPRAAALVEALARGVAEAHRVGIIHRDLKPGNVLLAADGTPKVTDFGLAKALGSDAGLTRTDSILGSPGYMAPEQATGKAKLVGPLADVYSLGAILYELLTGRPPFVGTTVLEILEQVKTIEPVPPSRLVPGLSRDVETLALKCLQKEPARRYESAAALAEDLRRFVGGEPIVARPVPFWDRAWRWCRRHPAPAALTAALVLVAALGLAGILWQWDAAVEAGDLASRGATAEAAARRDADSRRIEAESSLAIARKAVDDSFTKVSESNLLNVPGMRSLRRELLESALAFYEEFVRRDNAKTDLLAELAATQARIGQIYSELSEPEKARGALERAAQLYEKTLTDRPGDLALLERLSEVEHRLGDVGSLSIPPASGAHQRAAKAAYQRAITIRERLAGERPGEPRFRMALSRSWNAIGVMTAGDADAQRDAFTRALALRLQLAGEIADDPDLLHGLSGSFQNLFVFLLGSGHREEALELARRSIEYGRAGLARRPHDFEFAFDLNIAYSKAGDTCWELGHRDEALAILAERVSFLRKLSLENPEVSTYRIEFADTLAGHASWLVELNRSVEGASWLREASEVLEANPGPDGAILAKGATYRARAALYLAGQVAAQPIESWPEAARIQTNLAVTDLKRAVGLGFRDSGVIRQSLDFRPLLVRSDVKALIGDMDHAPANVSSAAAAPEAAPVRMPSPLDQAGRLEEDRILGDLAIALVEGNQGDSGQYTARLGAILERIDSPSRSGRASPALERSAESIRVWIGEELAGVGKLAEARGLLSRLRDARSDQPQTLFRSGALLAQAGFPDRAEALFARAVALAPHDPVIYRMVAADHARRAWWDLAAKTIADLVVQNPDDHWNWYLAAVVTARAADPARYRRMCRQMLDRFHETNDPEIAERTAKSCLLSPSFGPEQEEACRLAERAVATATGLARAWALSARGLAEYRGGAFADALASVEQAYAAASGSGPWHFEAPAGCVRAMALLRLGRRDEARAALGEVSSLYRSNSPGTIPHAPDMYWTGPLICEILYREAEALILYDPVFPADPFAR